MVSKNGKAKLVMQQDGNLVLYCTGNNRVLWSSGTYGKSIDLGLKIKVGFSNRMCATG